MTVCWKKYSSEWTNVHEFEVEEWFEPMLCDSINHLQPVLCGVVENQTKEVCNVKCDRKLIGDKTRRTSKVKTMEFLLAAAAAGGQANLEKAAVKFEKVINGVNLGCITSAPGTEDEVRPINLEGGEEECITSFKECGSVMEEKGGGEKRVDKVARAFGALIGPTFELFYYSYTWTAKAKSRLKLNTCIHTHKRNVIVSRTIYSE